MDRLITLLMEFLAKIGFKVEYMHDFTIIRLGDFKAICKYVQTQDLEKVRESIVELSDLEYDEALLVVLGGMHIGEEKMFAQQRRVLVLEEANIKEILKECSGDCRMEADRFLSALGLKSFIEPWIASQLPARSR